MIECRTSKKDINNTSTDFNMNEDLKEYLIEVELLDADGNRYEGSDELREDSFLLRTDDDIIAMIEAAYELGRQSIADPY